MKDHQNPDIPKYDTVVKALHDRFGDRLKSVVLFGSWARGEGREDSDHDLLLVVEDLPQGPLERMRTVRRALIPAPLRIGTVAKTPAEFAANLTPLMLDICRDGICLYGAEYFEPYRRKALKALDESGLKRERVGREWYWRFEQPPQGDWELNWEGFREL